MTQSQNEKDGGNRRTSKVFPKKESNIIITTAGRTKQMSRLIDNAKLKDQDDSINSLRYAFKLAELEDVEIGQWNNPKTCRSSKQSE
ncbi:hypothetical protein HCB69_16000 [Listeria booriae]|uniref:Uncharacterized protein n=1 Tax=Listeria booriae TaxID=1552123 RepID=A0A842FS02_9LIST|nr:hypothetical protein [Listeria booriae]MBC2285879.1 hypothetical protein [Listeria booriae]